ncbi:TPA: alpha-1/alpha-2 family phenol-soluble modulin [Staphylococcus aureus]
MGIIAGIIKVIKSLIE